MKNGFTLIELMIVLAIIAITFASVYSATITCEAKARAMGKNHEWGLLQGCMIEVEKGRWVPLENYRAL